VLRVRVIGSRECWFCKRKGWMVELNGVRQVGLGWHSEYMGSSELGFQVAEYYEGACSI
jgi:hypothetical protein